MADDSFRPRTDVTRGVNELVLEVAKEDDEVLEFLCECARIACVETLTLTAAMFRRMAADGPVLAEGHGP
jgi:hypothetical protein